MKNKSVLLNFLGRNLNNHREIIIIAAEMDMTVSFTGFTLFGTYQLFQVS